METFILLSLYFLAFSFLLKLLLIATSSYPRASSAKWQDVGDATIIAAWFFYGLIIYLKS